jgi:hypothetical protein
MLLPPDQLRQIAQGRVSRLLENTSVAPPTSALLKPGADPVSEPFPAALQPQDQLQAAKAFSGQAQASLSLFEHPLGSLYQRPELIATPIPRAIPIDEGTLLPIASGSPSAPAPVKAPPVKTSPETAPEPSTVPEPRYEKSPYHDPKKFVPSFPMMAYHESGSYRNRKDPYGVGAITYPSRKQDSGGKTYGTYQFETYVYKNGSRGSDAKVANSTMMRFLKWDKNPFAAELNAVVKRYGVASSQFDQAWKKLASEQNLALGKAQEAFVLHDKMSKVDAFLADAQLSEEVKQDPRIFDLVLGTLNHVDSLAAPIPKMLARKQREAGHKLSANEVGKIITAFKGTQISNWFVSSPKAHKGIRDRFKSEGRVFA